VTKNANTFSVDSYAFARQLSSADRNSRDKKLFFRQLFLPDSFVRADHKIKTTIVADRFHPTAFSRRQLFKRQLFRKKNRPFHLDNFFTQTVTQLTADAEKRQTTALNSGRAQCGFTF